MKIKLAILERDENYLEQIMSVFSIKYADRFELYSFTDLTAAMSVLENARIEVVLVNESFDVELSEIPSRCSLAYFVESADVEMLRGQRAICKFQKAENIYKQILDLYSEKAGSNFGMRIREGKTRTFLFDSISGGTGTSSMAAACALHFTQRGKKTLYLNLERFGASEIYFSADGKSDMSDVIYALKSRKINLSLKLESCVRQDASGVFFYAGAKIALDMLELHPDEVICLFAELRTSGGYDYVIIDADNMVDKAYFGVYDQADAVVWVSDGSAVSNEKLQRAYKALLILEQNTEISVHKRLSLIYNKFSNKTGMLIGDMGPKSLGGAPRYERANTGQVLSRLSEMELFDKLIEIRG